MYFFYGEVVLGLLLLNAAFLFYSRGYSLVEMHWFLILLAFSLHGLQGTVVTGLRL